MPKNQANAKQQHPKDELYLGCLEIVYILHLKMIGHILKDKQEQVCLYSWDYMMNYNQNEDGNEK